SRRRGSWASGRGWGLRHAGLRRQGMVGGLCGGDRNARMLSSVGWSSRGRRAAVPGSGGVGRGAYRGSSGSLGGVATRMLLHAPAARPAVEHVGVVEEAIEERADGGDVAEELAPVLDRPVRAEQCADPPVPALVVREEVR